MKAKTSLLPFVIGLSVVILFAIGLGIYVLALSGKAKTDADLNKTANSVADSLNVFTSTSGSAPSSLSMAYKKPVPSDISYKKLSDSSYQLCATYRTKDTGGYASVIFGSYAQDQSHQQGALYLSTTHNSGQNCYTVDQLTPTITTADAISQGAASTSQPSGAPAVITDPREQAIASGNQDTVCGQPGFKTHYAGTVVSVKTADGKPLVPTVTQDLLVEVRPQTDGAKGNQITRMAGSGFNVFNSTCIAQSHQSLKAGDEVSVFLDNPAPYTPGQMVDFSLGAQ